MSHGHYLNDDTVDMHGVLVGRWRPGTVFAVARAGLFRSTDQVTLGQCPLGAAESQGADILP